MFFMGRTVDITLLIQVAYKLQHKLIHMNPKDYKPRPTIESFKLKNCSNKHMNKPEAEYQPSRINSHSFIR